MSDLPPELLKAIGEALFGARWHAELAGALGVSDRTLRRWAAGQADIPAGIARDLAQIVRRRRTELDRALEQLDAISRP
jgi:transcriptional regulator with XRE-family HTH domain